MWMRAMLGAAVLSLMAACSSSEGDGRGGEEPAVTPPAAPEKAPPTPPPDDRTAGPSVDDPRFSLRASAEEGYTTGQLGRFGITIAAREGWHVNQEYPTRVTLRPAEGLSLPKSELEKADAAEFGEERARFDVPFTPGQAGELRCAADVDFAVCTDETCIPVQHTIAVVLPVR